MAGTRVRYCRESLAETLGAARILQPGCLRRCFSRGLKSLAPHEALLAVFVALQVTQALLLCAQGLITLPLAFCLSASLLTVAQLTSLRRADHRLITTTARDAGCLEIAVAPAAEPSPAVAPPLSGGPAPMPFDGREATQGWAELMARISHELRTPLNAVIGFSDLMQREIFGPLGHARYADYAAHIKDSGDALLKSAEDTLALSSLLARPTAGERPQVCDLAALVADAWRVLDATARRRGIALDAHIAEGVEIAGDRRAFRQAVLNLMAEAVSRAADDTHITVEARIEGCVVALKVRTPHGLQRRRETMPSLPLCIARTLFERMGTTLITAEDGNGQRWQAVGLLERAVQDDFFTARPGRLSQPYFGGGVDDGA